MPFYNYKVKTETGAQQAGKVEAVSMEKAATILQEKGLFIVSLTPVREGVLASFFATGKMKFDEVVVFTRQLSAIVEAGFTLNTGINLLMQQAIPRVRVVMAQLLADLEAGLSFSQALAKHPKIFSKTYVYLVQAGESSGTLDVVLSRLADSMEEQKNFKGKVKGALIYPIAIFIVMIIVVVVMMTVVVPKLMEVFAEFDAKLPLATQILIAMSNAFLHWWWAIILAIVVLTIFFVVWYQGYEAKKIVDKFLFSFPVVGSLRKKSILTNYTHTLAMLIQSGVPMIDSLNLSAEMVKSVNYREHLDEVRAKVEKGVAIGVAMEEYDDFPMIMSQMVRVGEETGKLDQILFKLSRYFAGEAERALAGVMAAIEPAIMLLMGLGVGFLVIAIIMPIYDLTNQVAV